MADKVVVAVVNASGEVVKGGVQDGKIVGVLEDANVEKRKVERKIDTLISEVVKQRTAGKG
jgi:hypothetical protein